MRQIVFLLIFMMVTACSAGSDAPTTSINEVTNPQPLVETTQGKQALTNAADSPAPLETAFHLVILGDSITAGYGLNAKQALPSQLEHTLLSKGHNITIINAGVSGDTTADALNRFDWSVEEKANGVLIALGGNDLLQGINPAKSRANLASIIEAAKSRNLVIMLAGMRAPGNYGENYQREFDQIFPDLAHNYDIPLYPFLLNDVATNPALNQPDGIHPNEAGVSIIVNGLIPFIERNIP